MVKRILKPESRQKLKHELRVKQRRFIRASEQAGAIADKHLFDRLSMVGGIRRFLLSWLLLVVMLIGGTAWQVRSLSNYYKTLQPSEGGSFREGVVGSFTNANPIFATSVADTTVSNLIFSGLLSFDANNQLVGSLAQDWSVDSSGKIYTVNLRPNVVWHDGQPLTAGDVVFTFQTIQDADARSPLFRNWQGITVAEVDPDTVSFTLSSALTGFEYSLTTGILPKHLLQEVDAGQMRNINFNTIKPVGTGPFKMASVEVIGNSVENRQEIIAMDRNESYYLGKVRMNSYVLRVFRSSNLLAHAFNAHELNAAIGLSPSDLDHKDTSITTHNIPQTSQVMIFLNNSSPLLNDAKVRRGLTMATNVPAILSSIGYPVVRVDQPFLRGETGYDNKYAQYSFNLEEANKSLDEAGWLRGENGYRFKDGTPLKIRLFSQSLAEYALVVQKVQEQWKAAGVEVDAILQPEEELQTGALARHDYDALLYGISIGADSDVYPYWHSTQADPRSPTRLNLSEFKNTTADTALAAGRSREDDNLRAVKYRPFSEIWRTEAPAIGLYQPRFYYVVRGELNGLNLTRVNGSADRLRNVQNWAIRQDLAPKE